MTTPATRWSSSPCPRGGRNHRHTILVGGEQTSAPCTDPALWRRLLRAFTRGGAPLIDGAPFIEPRGFSAAVWLREDEQRQAGR